MDEQFGRYRLVRLLARGGMAEVYVAALQGAAGVEKRLALKKILPVYQDLNEFVDLFEHEGRISSSLDHPNIVQVFEFGQYGENLYIAMEFVDGPDLRRLISASTKRHQPLSLDCILTVGTRLAAALEYAHNKTDGAGRLLEVVHRDVSPSNILLSVQGEVKLTDFGVASCAQRVSDTNKPGLVRGKHAYMSPEQLTGQAVDHRSDLFSLGTVLFEMITGENPFLADTDFRTMQRVVAAELPAVKQVRSDLPDGLGEIVDRCLAQDPEQRFSESGAVRGLLAEQLRARRVADGNGVLVDEMWSLFPRQLQKRGLDVRGTRAAEPSRPTLDLEDGVQQPSPPPQDEADEIATLLEQGQPDMQPATRSDVQAATRTARPDRPGTASPSRQGDSKRSRSSAGSGRPRREGSFLGRPPGSRTEAPQPSPTPEAAHRPEQEAALTPAPEAAPSPSSEAESSPPDGAPPAREPKGKDQIATPPADLQVPQIAAEEKPAAPQQEETPTSKPTPVGRRTSAGPHRRGSPFRTGRMRPPPGLDLPPPSSLAAEPAAPIPAIPPAEPKQEGPKPPSSQAPTALVEARPEPPEASLQPAPTAEAVLSARATAVPPEPLPEPTPRPTAPGVAAPPLDDPALPATEALPPPPEQVPTEDPPAPPYRGTPPSELPSIDADAAAADAGPPVHEEAPPVHEEAPPVHEEAPPVHEEAPPVHEEAPPVHKEAPPVHDEVPATQAAAPLLPAPPPSPAKEASPQDATDSASPSRTPADDDRRSPGPSQGPDARRPEPEPQPVAPSPQTLAPPPTAAESPPSIPEDSPPAQAPPASAMRQDLEEPPVSQPLGNALEEDGRPPVLPPPIKRSFNPWPWVGGLLAACALASAIYFLIPSSPTPAPPTPLETQFVLPPDTVRPFGEPGDSGGAVRVSAGLEAHLAVDGLILDKDLPMTLLLEEGNHNFFLTKPRDGIAIKRTVTVRRGESVELRFDLPPGAGRTP